VQDAQTTILFKKLGINGDQFSSCKGYPIQKQIHRELVHVVRESAVMHNASIDELVQVLTKQTVKFADKARCYNNANNMESALGLTDVCWASVNYLKSSVFGIVEEAKELGVVRFAQGVGTGFTRSLENAKQLFDVVENAISRPGQALVGAMEFVSSLASAARNCTFDGCYQAVCSGATVARDTLCALPNARAEDVGAFFGQAVGDIALLETTGGFLKSIGSTMLVNPKFATKAFGRDLKSAMQVLDESLAPRPAKSFAVSSVEGGEIEIMAPVSEIGLSSPAVAKAPVAHEGSIVLAKDCWDMPNGPAIINGRKYSQHALERMAPDTLAVKAELSSRAIAEGITFRSKKYYERVGPRGIPPLVIEEVIKTAIPTEGKIKGTWDYIANNIKVVLNDTGDVVTVFKIGE